MRLGRRREPFSHRDWPFEIKHDGFRSLAYVGDGKCRLISRHQNQFKSFNALCASIAAELRVGRCILDGEIVALDADGRSDFNDLLFRRGEPRFYAFDLLWSDGEDLRLLPLPDRKQRLRQSLPKKSERLLYCDHIDERGEELFRFACDCDLEGIVAKHKFSPYSASEETSWVKIKNPAYSQILGRDELFDRMAGREPASARLTDGWAGCALVCAEADM
jgi:bifunctional non-homologous end joining protein LigD